MSEQPEFKKYDLVQHRASKERGIIIDVDTDYRLGKENSVYSISTGFGKDIVRVYAEHIEYVGGTVFGPGGSVRTLSTGFTLPDPECEDIIDQNLERLIDLEKGE